MNSNLKLRNDYHPSFSKASKTSIPPVESFRLDKIINTVLKEESQQVIDQLLKVSTNYQTDLRLEIRKSLAIEQKIQSKNVQIAKLLNALNHTVVHKRKKIKKAVIVKNGTEDGENVLDVEINELLKTAVGAGDLVKSLSAKMAEIDRDLGYNTLKKYPNVMRIITKEEQKKRAREEDDYADDENGGEVEEVPKPVTEPVTEPVPKLESQYEPIRSVPKTTLESIEESPKSNGSTLSSAHVFPPDDDIQPEDYESFLTSSISKFREIQNKKYESYDPFKEPSKTIRPNHNPLGLLYSSLINSPSYSSSLSQPSHPFPSIISVKSPATIKSTLQTSHFKKLRINGAPITSETFRKLKEKENRESLEEAKTTANGENSTNSASLSPAKKALTESLMLIDNLRLSSDEDTWGSSGLNTETEDDNSELVEDPALSTDSSESDSGDEPNHHIASTNEYYSSFKTSLKNKKKLARPKKKHRGREFEAEASPTPKHQPSHHKLKPKRSILKTTVSSRSVPKSAKVVVPSIESALEPEYASDRSGISALNNAYDKSTRFATYNVTASGTILSTNSERHDSLDGIQEDEVSRDDDDQSIVSITRLKDYI